MKVGRWEGGREECGLVTIDTLLLEGFFGKTEGFFFFTELLIRADVTALIISGKEVLYRQVKKKKENL